MTRRRRQSLPLRTTTTTMWSEAVAKVKQSPVDGERAASAAQARERRGGRALGVERFMYVKL